MEEKFLEIAKQAALEAGEIISKYLGKQHELLIKEGDQTNFATAADLEAEKKIVEILTKNFPQHNIIGEENTRVNNNSPYTWVIDPLDGTFSFAHGFPYFAVSIGLLFANQSIIGVINHILGKNLYWAQKGKGAYLNNKPIYVSKTKTLADSACGLDFGHQKTRPEKVEKYIVPLLSKIGYPYSIGTTAVSLSFVAGGILDGYVNQAWVWDFAAGALIITEAGGRVSNFEGKEPDWNQDRLSIIASNGLIHDQILEALK